MAEKYKQCEIKKKKKKVICREACFSQKMFTNGLNMGLQKDSPWSPQWLFGKENILGMAVNKKVMSSILGYEKTHRYLFL